MSSTNIRVFLNLSGYFSSSSFHSSDHLNLGEIYLRLRLEFSLKPLIVVMPHSRFQRPLTSTWPNCDEAKWQNSNTRIDLKNRKARF